MSTAIDIDLLVARAQAMAASGRLAEALEMFADQAGVHSSDPLFWMVYGRLLLADDQLEPAAAAARRILEVEEGSPDGLDILIDCAHRSDRHEEALSLAGVLLARAPDAAKAHAWFGVLLVDRRKTSADLDAAGSAMARALDLEPENPDYYRLAAVIASLRGYEKLALSYLGSGLAIAPNDRGLLRASEIIDGSSALVGDRARMLRGLLAANPLDDDLHGDFAQVFLGKLRPLAWLPWVYAMLGAVLIQRGSGAIGVVAALLLAAVLGGFGFMLYSRAARPLPDGYAGTIFDKAPAARTGLRLQLAAGLTGTVGIAAGILGIEQRWGLLLLGAGAVLAFVGGTLLDRAAAVPPEPGADAKHHVGYGQRRIAQLLGAHRKRFLIGAISLPAIVSTLPDMGPPAGMIMLVVAGWALAVGVQLAGWVLRIGPAENPWVRYRQLQRSGGQRSAAFRGGAQSLLFICLQVLVPLLFVVLGLVFFTAPADSFDSVRSPVQNGKPPTPLPSYLQPGYSPRPVPTFEIPTMPSIEIPDFTGLPD